MLTTGPRACWGGPNVARTAAAATPDGRLRPVRGWLDRLLDGYRSTRPLANRRIRTAQVVFHAASDVSTGIRPGVDPDVTRVRNRLERGAGNRRSAAGCREKCGRDKECA